MLKVKLVNEIQRKKETTLCNNKCRWLYFHTSVAIHDALKILNIPIIERILLIYIRERIFFVISLLLVKQQVVLFEIGTQGYTLALKASIDLIKMKIDKNLLKNLGIASSEFNITRTTPRCGQ